VARLNGRVRRLEGFSRQCPECGWPPAPGEEVEIKVYWPDLDGPELDEQPEDCSTCGRPGETVVRWLDLEEQWGARDLDGD
jgi:hypothetical protein